MATDTRQNILDAATVRFRQAGYVATSVDDICDAAGISKGAFFHHFKSKEDLALAALRQWRNSLSEVSADASFQQLADPARKLFACLDFYVDLFAGQKKLLACLAGITAQEVADTHPALRDAANACFVSGIGFWEPLLAAAAKHRHKELDTPSLATLFMTTLQGALLLARASGNPALVPESLRHYKAYVQSLLEVPPTQRHGAARRRIAKQQSAKP